MVWRWNADGDNQSQYVQKIFDFNSFCDPFVTEVSENDVKRKGIGN